MVNGPTRKRGKQQGRTMLLTDAHVFQLVSNISITPFAMKFA